MNKLKLKSLKLKIIIFLFLILLIFMPSFTPFHNGSTTISNLEAKVYIDITSPAFKKLLLGIQDFSGDLGKEIADIIRNDLEFTGLFECVDKTAYLEEPSQVFNPRNWTPLGIEAVVKGVSKIEENDLIAKISLYDVFEGNEILRKEYKAEKDLMRQLSHAVANDIYFMLTGKEGIFRTRIAFIGEEKGEKQLYLMDWDGGRISKTGLKGNVIISPRWSSDGTKIIFSAERNRQWGIFLLDFITMREKKVFFSQATNIGGDFLPNGYEFTFSSSKDGTPDLYIMNLNNNNVKKLTSFYGIEISPSVSPDGKYIAFVSDRSGSPQIYTMQMDGSDLRRITFEGSYNTSPAWSPKGDKIVFTGRIGSKNQIFIINPDGTGLTQLTTEGNNEDPSFSPDGRYITFSSDRDVIKGIYIMRANGEAQRRVTPKSLKSYSPRWSPN